MEWKKLESRQNPAVKFAASLQEKKARDHSGTFSADGMTILRDLARIGLFPSAVYLAEFASSLREQIESLLQGRCVELYSVSSSAFDRLTSEKGSEGVVSLYSKTELSQRLPLSRHRRLVALERVQDPGNVGTILRSAAAFGFDGVFTVDCADPFSPKAIRSSMGAFGVIPIKSFSRTEEMLDYLEKKGVRTVAAALREGARPIGELKKEPPLCVLIGNEGQGLSETALSRADECSIIPIRGMESLNAAAAATVFLWELSGRGEA